MEKIGNLTDEMSLVIKEEEQGMSDIYYSKGSM